ncbi:MAG: hypothetical protein OXP68_07440 [Anaerolineaceae bacterium]|nr:hypothetical protein [Anaerolineaceae bacterium]MDE0330048.1 hypothetical protein [Anaerolineaceae bacterium]
MEVLNLDLLESGSMQGLTSKAGGFLLEACLVCLAHNGHSSGIAMQVDEARDTIHFRLDWSGSVGEQETRTHADMQDATEWGACGVACLLICKLTGLVVTRRSRKGTGFDYWLGSGLEKGSATSLPFQDEARLEVSGMLSEERMSEINSRLREKTKQIKGGKRTDLTGYAVVLEFSRPLAKVKRLEGTDKSQRTA